MSDAHLDEAAFSDVLDGSGTSDQLAHVVSCAECGAELDRWRAALARISEPPPADPALREVAVAAALSAARASMPPPVWRRPPVLRAIAGLAATIVAVVGIGILAAHVSKGSGGSKSSTASGTIAGPAPTSVPAGASGAQSGATKGSSPGRSPAASGRGSNGQGSSASTSTPVIVPSANSPATDAVPRPLPSPPLACQSQAARDAGHPTSYSLFRSVTDQGTPAYQWVFPLGSGRSAYIVVKASDCSLLSSQTRS